MPWERPKVVMSAKRKSRSPWRIAAFADDTGLVCYQTFTSVWPTAGWNLDLIAAILNSPVANAFVATHEGNRDITNEIIDEIPIPLVSKKTAKLLSKLIAKYVDASSEIALLNPQCESQSRELLLQLDAIILRAAGKNELRPLKMPGKPSESRTLGHFFRPLLVRPERMN